MKWNIPNKIALQFGSGTATGENDSAYIYFYNLGDSSKYSFVTHQSVGLTNENYFMSAFEVQFYHKQVKLME